MNIADTPTFVGQNREAWKRAFVEHLRDLGLNFALTLSWNRTTPLVRARGDLAVVHRLVDQELLGPRFHKKPSSARTLAVFMLEGLDDHIHAHSLWRIRGSQNLLRFTRLFSGERGGIWNRIVETGSYKLDINDDPEVFGGYALKAQHTNSDADEVIWSLDFLK